MTQSSAHVKHTLTLGSINALQDEQYMYALPAQPLNTLSVSQALEGNHGLSEELASHKSLIFFLIELDVTYVHVLQMFLQLVGDWLLNIMRIA